LVLQEKSKSLLTAFANSCLHCFDKNLCGKFYGRPFAGEGNKEEKGWEFRLLECAPLSASYGLPTYIGDKEGCQLRRNGINSFVKSSQKSGENGHRFICRATAHLF
jgi:hypothetical protein